MLGDTSRVLYRAYIDESGDRGVKPTASGHFVVAATIVANHDERAVRDGLATLRSDLGRRPDDVLHFRHLKHLERVYAAQTVAALPIHATTAVIVGKAPLMDGSRPTQLRRPDALYNYSMRLLLERITWCVEQARGTGLIVTFGEISGFESKKLHIYRERLEARSDVNINWKLLEGHPFRIDRPAETEILQVADIAASSVFGAIEPQMGNTEPRYLREIGTTLYRGKSGRGLPTTYGLKVFPTDLGAPGGPLAHLREM